MCLLHAGRWSIMCMREDDSLWQGRGRPAGGNASDKAGVFVSVRKGGALRGCIGTIEPVCRNIAEEIIQNAVSAGIHDPRFPSVRREELSFLEYSVDVLGETEQIQGEDQLDRCVTASLSPRAEKGDCCFQIWREWTR